jgi:hypothetical protein
MREASHLSLPDTARMQRVRAATATVALVSEDPSLVDLVVTAVRDETTLADVHPSFAVQLT